MKKIINLHLFLTALILMSPTVGGQTAAGIEGNWLGTLDFSGVKLRLILKITKTGDGLTAKFDSVDQGAKDLPIDSISRQGSSVTFSAARFGMSFEGTLSEKEDEISGTFKQGGGSTPLVFRRVSELPKISRPQEPSKPYPYAEQEVFYKNPKDNINLAGTLTLPRGEGKHPAVILITGSGAQDRDGTVAGHRPFFVLADYLTRKGIAVLRVDDRGIGGSGGGSLSETSEDFAGDVLAGVEYLKTRKEISSKQIGLVGHSEGGLIAPIAAARSKDVAFIVLLSGMGQTGEELLLTQMELLQKASGQHPEAIARAIDFQKSLYAVIKSEPDNLPAERKINEMLAKRQSKMNERELKESAQIEAELKSHLPLMLSPWYRYFLSYNPRPTLEKVKVPVLALNGENDLQVASKENLNLIAAALKAGKNKDFTVKSFPKLNHLFQTSRTGTLDEYDKIEETIAPAVLETVADWILKRTTER